MSKKKASLLIRSDGTEAEVSPRAAVWSLGEMQGHVGGFIELVLHTKLATGMVMFVNEDGRMRGLPPNRKASMLADVPIVGDVLIVPVEQVE